MKRGKNGSTGPRTAAGKQRSRLNAYRHGLATPIRDDPRFRARMHRLARALVGRNASPAVEAAAHEVAECQLQLMRIEEVRVSILSALVIAMPEPTEISPEFMTEVRGIFGTPLMPAG